MSNYRDRLYKRVESDIPKHLAKHDITVKHESGLYRHWRCQEPGESNHSFHIVCWPYNLCYTGDMGDYLFQRTEDMVAFMARTALSFDYIASKCIAHGGDVKEWRKELLEEELREVLQENPDLDEAVATIRQKIAYSDGDQHVAMQAAYESGIWDGCDTPHCTELTYRFLWCLHAIHWFCERVPTQP